MSGPWQIEWDGETVTDDDLTVDVAYTAAAWGDGTWASLDPWGSPIAAANLTAIVIAKRRGVDPLVVSERLRVESAVVIMPSKRDLAPPPVV